MPPVIVLDRPLSWREIGAIAEGAPIALSPAAQGRVREARRRVQSIVAQDIRAYGVNTGVGALCDVIVTPSRQRQLSRNIVMSTAVGVGPALEAPEVRAIIAAAINNFAHGYSGVRMEVVDRLLEFLARECIPEVPADGSVGYLSHMAHIALVLLGAGRARVHGELFSGAEALRAAGLQPLVLEAKEGLSLVNGTPCVTGLTALALTRIERLLDWADVIGAMTFENLHGQVSVFEPEGLKLRGSAQATQNRLSRRINIVDRAAGRGAGLRFAAGFAGARVQDRCGVPQSARACRSLSRRPAPGGGHRARRRDAAHRACRRAGACLSNRRGSRGLLRQAPRCFCRRPRR
jgi:histidine ammonia-lyase